MRIKVILIDFGGVLAEEGFSDGLREIARKNDRDPDEFFALADRLIAESGYLIGKASESDYWQALRRETGIAGSDAELRAEILGRFVLRRPVVACVDRLRASGFRVFLLTDQTDWLDDIDREEHCYAHVDGVYNSFRTGRSKRDERTFPAICKELGVRAGETLFIDDNAGHVERAARSHLYTIHYTSFEDFSQRLRALTGTGCGA